MRAFIYGIFILLASLLLKLEAPSVIRQTLLLASSSFPPEDEVTEVQGNTLTIKTANNIPETVQLAGLATPSAHWQAEETGVLGMLMKNSPVAVQCVSQCQPGQNQQALVKLPNGTLLQSIVLSDGVSQLDPQQLKQLPQTTAIALETAQSLAQSQHKNIWGL
jgi:hypothetical protein